MSEYAAANRRNWKGIVFPYDHFIPDDSKECQYCLTELEAEIIRGIIEPLGWKTRWWSDVGSIDEDLIVAFRDNLVRKLMMSCCGDETPVQFRWTEDGELERSEDGGTTWIPAPEFDPRNNSTQFPPVPGEPSADKKCIAATGMSDLIKLQVGDNLTDDMSRFTLGELISDWIQTLIGTSNPFQALIVIATNQIFALIISVLRAALTSTVYDLLTCIFYCRMEDDISFTAAGVDSVTSDIGDQIGGIATLFLQQLVNLLGVVGMTNLARSGAATEGDCSECTECLTCVQKFHLETAHFGGGTIIASDDTSITITSTNVGGAREQICISTNTVGVGCVATSVEQISGGYSDFVDWIDVGDAISPGNIHFGYIAQCANTFLLFRDSGVPFTTKFTLTDC